jgi:hypothetical protein
MSAREQRDSEPIWNSRISVLNGNNQDSGQAEPVAAPNKFRGAETVTHLIVGGSAIWPEIREIRN